MILVFAYPALKRWANEFRRYAADTGTLSAANLSPTNFYAETLYATNFRLRTLVDRERHNVLPVFLCAQADRLFGTISQSDLKDNPERSTETDYLLIGLRSRAGLTGG
jgi:hypothetical protein